MRAGLTRKCQSRCRIYENNCNSHGIEIDSNVRVGHGNGNFILRHSTHLKLIFFNYLELFVSNAKLVYSLWYRVSWATSKTSLSTSFIEPKLFDELQVFFCLLFNAEKNWRKHAIARLYTRIQVTWLHNVILVVEMFECFLIVCFHYWPQPKRA